MAAVTLRLSKHHSNGNDFLVALMSEPPPGTAFAGGSGGGLLADPNWPRTERAAMGLPGGSAGGLLADPSAAAAALCHRRRGVGADGLVLGIGAAAARMPDRPGTEGGGYGEALGGFDEAGSARARGRAGPVRMRLWNSDGSEAEVSGNGLRCLAQALTRGTNEIDIEIDTPAGPRRCRLEPGADPRTATGRVEMGAVTLDALSGDALNGDALDGDALGGAVDSATDFAGSGPDLDRLPAALAGVEGFTGRWRSGSVGNPHMVVEVADPDAVDLEAAGPAVEACFAGGANVHFAAAAGPRRVRMRIWERGAGVTEACGSGAAVAAAAFAAWGWGAWTAPGDESVAAGGTAGSGAGSDAGKIAEAMPGGEPGPVVTALSGGEADEVIVAMPGGETRVHLGPPVALTGPVVHVADIEVVDIEIAEMPGMAGSTIGHRSGR